MKFSATKSHLVEALSRCAPLADKKSTMPVLGNVLIDTNTGAATIAATDLYLGMRTRVMVACERPGSVSLPARDLLERVKAMPDGEVSIDVDDDAKATIRAKGSKRRFVLPGQPGSEYPTLPEPEGDAVKMPAAALAQLLNATHFAISADETRLHLNSLCLKRDGETVRAVSTDGHRMSTLALTSPECNTDMMLLPLKGAQALRQLCDTEGDIVIRRNATTAFFDAGAFTFSVKLVDAQFPPWEQVIPGEAEQSILVPREPLIDAVQAVRLAANERTGGIVLDFSRGKITVRTESPESGEASDECEAEGVTSSIAIGVAAQYVLDALKALDTEQVRLEVSGDLEPIVVKPATVSSGADSLGVVMPMRV